MDNKRPVNLDLFTIKQPLPAIVSILHRISGLFLFIGAALLICALQLSLESEQSFVELQQSLGGLVAKLLIWLVLAALIYHLIAGIRHMLMDMGIGESLQGGRMGAKLVLGLSAVLIVFAGVVLW